MLDIVCWFWAPKPTYRSQFSPQHVNILFNMVRRFYNHPHRFSVITDLPDAPYHRDIRVIPLWSDYKDMQSVWGVNAPACFRRLKAFAPEMRDIIGPRFVSLDLDVLLCDDVAPVWNRKEDFIIWGEDNRRTPYNGSMWMMNAGARRQVWDRFIQKPAYILDRARASGFYGSDQAVMCYVLGREEARWTSRDGVFSYRMHSKLSGGRKPDGARIVFFEGSYDPWTLAPQKKHEWIKENYK